MLKLDTLSQLKQLKEDIKASRNLEEGIVKGSTYKFGFVTLDSGRDVYLPPDQMERVLPGDRVEVEIVKDAKNKKVAKLEKLIDSPTKFFCGKYITKGKTHFVEPDINGMTRWFFVPPNKRKNAKMKDLVQCKVTQHPFKSGKAQAALVEVIGTESDKGIETHYACMKHRLSQDWSADAKAQAESFTEADISALAKERKDFTSLPLITIDSESTSDIDDALYVLQRSDGWDITVAIADPTSLIPQGSPIEKEALKRANSVYFPGKHIPMLPSSIASDLCALAENKVRLAKVLTISLDAQGDIQGYELTNGAVKSHHKMSYSLVSSLLTDSSDASDLPTEYRPDILESIQSMKAVSDVLLQNRREKFVLPKERKEFYFEFNDEGKVSDIKRKSSTVAHKIVEELMILANRCIANMLSETNKNSLFIAHKGIRDDRRESLDKVLLESFPDYKTGDINQLETFANTYRKALSDEALEDYQLLISRQLEKSAFSSEASPHFGMGLKAYTTFTSPLRKASDYLIHRQLNQIIDNQSAEIKPSLITRLEESIQNSRNAVYDVEQWLRCQFLNGKDSVLDAHVQRIFSSGFHVRLSEWGIEGFVSTKEMDEKFSFNQERLTLSSPSFDLKLDSKVSVKLKHIDWSRKQIQFELVKND